MINRVPSLLRSTRYENCRVERLVKEGYEYPDLFVLTNPEGQRFYLKIADQENPTLNVSLPLLEKMKNPNSLIQKYRDILKFEGLYGLITEEITLESSVPITSGSSVPRERSIVPDQTNMKTLFRRLAGFHKENMNLEEKITSNYLDYEPFNSVSELVDAEFRMHKTSLPERFVPGIASVVEPLKKGFKTVIHGNIHKGNMIQGEFPQLIDTETLHMSCNLYDFEYFDLSGFYGNSQLYFHREARECYDAYFEELNYGESETLAAVCAIEMLNLLREITFRTWQGELTVRNWAEPKLDSLIEMSKQV